jgi:hypothetical protein
MAVDRVVGQTARQAIPAGAKICARQVLAPAACGLSLC